MRWIFVLLIVSCSVSRKMDRFIGMDRSDVIAHFGIPDRTDKSGREEVLIYASRIFQTNQYGTIDKYRYRVFFISPSGGVTGWVVRDESIAPENINVTILRR